MIDKTQNEKVAAFVKVSKDVLTGPNGNDYMLNTLTAILYGHIATASKEQGEITVYVKAPSFLDWLLRRTKTIVIPYDIRQLMKMDYIPETLHTIDFGPQSTQDKSKGEGG